MIPKIALTLLSLLSYVSTTFSFVSFSPSLCSLQIRPKFFLRMSASENYLNNLEQVFPKAKAETPINVYDNLRLQNAEVYNNKTEVNIDTIYMNIYKLDNIFFNRNSKSVMFRLKNEMHDIFYCENATIYRPTNNTRITSNALRKFIIGEMDPKIDAIMYKQEKL